MGFYLSLTLLLLVPIIPAAILFYFLPKGKSEGSLRGKFEGFHFKFGGAFAGYIFLLLFESKILLPEISQQEIGQLWEITGTVDKKDAHFDPSNFRFLVTPPGTGVNPDGRFSIPMKIDVNKELPSVTIESSKYGTAIITLVKEGTQPPSVSNSQVLYVEVDKSQKKIKLKQPISLEVLPSEYQMANKTLKAEHGTYGSAN